MSIFDLGRGRRAAAERDELRRRVAELEREARKRPTIAQRAFWGGANDRTTAGMAFASRPTNSDIYAALPQLRARSRELSQNSDHVKGFLRDCATNVAGPRGQRLRARVPDQRGPVANSTGLDDFASDSLESAYKSQSMAANFSASGTISRREMEHLHIRTIARDGEAIYRKRNGWSGSKWRFALEPIDSELLDIYLNMPLRDGVSIRMGVEIDETYRPLAYHFRTVNVHTYDYVHNGRSYLRVPASEILHCFLREDATQVRGVPWTAAGIIRLNMLSHYEDQAVIGSRMGAAKMGFYEQDREAAALLADQREAAEEAGDTDSLGNLIEEVDPGYFGILPPGVTFKPFDPGYPNTAHGEFVSACLRSISVGLGVSYSSISGDYGSGSWSSLREESNAERSFWITLQEWVAETFLQPAYNAWLGSALLVGIPILGRNNAQLRPEDRRRYESVLWQGRRWKWTDPDKEANGYLKSIAGGATTVSQWIRDQGHDPQEVFEERAREIAEMQRLDIPTTDFISKAPYFEEVPADGGETQNNQS